MDQVQEIREKTDIVSFIQEYMPLKKAGRNFKTNCPFHNEATPSFVISPERQIWHCFGCGKGGDVFSFLMEYENMEFSESLRTLAKKSGITLKESVFKQGQFSEKEKIFEINNLALRFYHYLLTEHKAGIGALSYLKDKRKISKMAIDKYEIGFSPNSGNALTEFLMSKKGFSKNELLFSGVCIEKNGQMIDFFRGRIMFPLFDHRGNVTGFSGRGLTDNDVPKYLNTKETPVYHKGNMFFGLNIAKDEIKKANDVIIVEGEFDAISLYEENIKNVVAIKGTALTENQVALLSRFSPKVTLCLDQDSAGFEATKRSLEILEKKGLTVDTIILKNAKDPDEAIKSDPIGFKKALKEKIGIYDFMIDKFVSQSSVETAAGKKEITDNLLSLFSNISNEIIKEHYLKKLSKILDVSFESLEKETHKHKTKSQEEKIVLKPKNKINERELVEEFLLALILQSKNTKGLLESYKSFFKSYEFEAQSLGKIYLLLIDFVDLNNDFDQAKFIQTLPKELIASFDICFIYPLSKYGLDDSSDPKYGQEIIKKINRLKEYHLKDKARGKN